MEVVVRRGAIRQAVMLGSDKTSTLRRVVAHTLDNPLGFHQLAARDSNR